MIERPDFLVRASEAWGEPPAWVLAIADEANRTSLTQTAKRLDYSASTISQVISATYGGDLSRVERVANGALMGATVVCPVLGEIARNRCESEQRKPRRVANSTSLKLYRACRSGCVHSHLKGGRNAE